MQNDTEPTARTWARELVFYSSAVVAGASAAAVLLTLGWLAWR